MKGSVVCGFLVINFNIKVNGRNVIRISYERDGLGGLGELFFVENVSSEILHGRVVSLDDCIHLLLGTGIVLQIVECIAFSNSNTVPTDSYKVFAHLWDYHIWMRSFQ